MEQQTYADGFERGEALERARWERLIAESPRAKMYRFPDCDPIVIPKDMRLLVKMPMGGHVEVALVPIPKPVEEGDET